MLRERDQEVEVLFIERAHCEKDPWSGHISFPGGRCEPQDKDVGGIAERETKEELGFELNRGNRLGRIDDLQGRHAGKPVELVISCLVYTIDAAVCMRPNHEVQEALWVPFSRLLDYRQLVRHRYAADQDRTYPGIRIGAKKSHVVWGLTFRFLAVFSHLLGHTLPGSEQNSS